LRPQETKAMQDQSEVDLAVIIRSTGTSAEKSGYSGTAIFTKVKPLNIISGLPQDIIKKYKVTSVMFTATLTKRAGL